MARRQLKNKRAIVTGASSGIGHQLVKQLSAAGCNVVATARRKERLDQLIAECGSDRVVAVAGDVTDAQVRARVLNTCEQSFGGLDILVNNAGTTAMGLFEAAEPERLRKIFEVNFFALAEMSRIAIPVLAEGKDAILVNVSSVLAHRAVPLKSEYCASKFAVHGLSDALRAELGPQGIDVLLASPSTTNSELFDTALEDTTGMDWRKGGATAPDKVAAIIVKAIRTGKHEVIMTAGGKSLVWLDRLLPGLANRLIAKYGQ